MTATQPWNPSHRTRLLIGAATIWPPLYFAFFLAAMGFMFASTARHATGPFPTNLFRIIFPLHCFTMLLNFALIAVYVVHAVKSDRHTPEMRIVWILILFLGNMLAFPVYWWLYLRPSKGEMTP